MSGRPTLPLLKGQIDLETALGHDDNILAQLRYPAQQKQFWSLLAACKADIEAVIRHQLGVDWCHLCVTETWRSGSFNVAIPILLHHDERVFIRLPLPYRIGEEAVLGNAEEKLRTETAAYVWLEENCPDVPIPKLHGFGLPGGLTFTHPSNTPFLAKIMWTAWRWMLCLFRRPVPSHYVPRRLQHPLESGYLILSEAKGKMLALSWEEHRHDKPYRERLFRDLARISVSINKTPLPRIGSLSFGSDGFVTLCNRPLDLHFQMLENEGIPSGIPKHRTYAAVESYITDLLSLQDSKVVNQPNAIHDQDDGESQLAALAALRATMHNFICPEYREGPFFYTLSDLHQANIFVDEQWNIQAIIDLEWAYSKPIEMQLPPYWLTSRAVDGFYDDRAISEYEAVLYEYLDIYEAEEKRRNGFVLQAPIKRRVWKTGAFWYFYAVSVPKGMYNIFNRHVQPLFNRDHPDQAIFDEVFFWYWGFGAQGMIDKKLRDQENYLTAVREAFDQDG